MHVFNIFLIFHFFFLINVFFWYFNDLGQEKKEQQQSRAQRRLKRTSHFTGGIRLPTSIRLVNDGNEFGS